jgi:hypothetical protein
MAKELPFFKFNASEWITGNISYESYELQGVFIKLCAEYWNRNNQLTKEDAIRRIKEPELIEELIKKGYIKQKRKEIKIKFLDTERNEITAKRLKLSEAGRKGGLSKAKGTLKHKEIEVEVEIDKEIDKEKEVKEIPHDWRNENLGVDGFQIKKI